jgi:salicylate hydroxylase
MAKDQGQAGAQAIEDSVALGIMLEGLTKSDVKRDPGVLVQRLELYQSVRRRRASAMQIFSNYGQDQGEKCAEAVRPYHDGPVPSMSIIL